MAMIEGAEQLSSPASPPGQPITAWFGAMIALTLIAIATGAVVGLHFAETAKKGLRNSSQSAPATTTSKYAGATDLRELPPIIANLADPADAWVRLQVSIVYDGGAGPKPDVMATQIAEDILGFLRTVTLAQIGGASGLQHLREDLNERATIRSEGQVRELIIQTLVVQ